MSNLDDFINGYKTALLWAGLDWAPCVNNPDANPDPLDLHYSTDDLSPDALVAITRDCTAFVTDNADTLALYAELIDFNPSEFAAYDLAGHDFLLTRNGHGAGFWDRGLPSAIADPLTDAAAAYGETDEYADGGLIYL